jgi:hypothetical protein
VKRTRTMGIAVAMALALTAVTGASAASASEFQSAGAGYGETTTWNGSRTGENHKLHLGEDWFSCNSASFSGQMTGPSATELTVTPSLSGCMWNQQAVGWTMNGCKYRLHAGSGSGSQSVGTVDIAGCEDPMSFTGFGCKLEIGNQNGIGTVEYKNITGGKVTAIANLSGITYNRISLGGCTNQTNGTFSDGTYTGQWNVAGLNSKGESRNIAIAGPTPPPPPPPTRFVAEARASISAESINAKFIGTREGALQCKSKWATELPTGEADSITVTPILSGCSFNGQITGFSTSYGGCSFKHYASGAFEIVGATCASNPFTIVDTNVGEECTITIGPQGPLAIFTVTNEGSGAARKVKMNANQLVANLKYTAAGPHCREPGTFSDGQYKPTGISVTAKNSKGETRGIWVE